MVRMGSAVVIGKALHVQNKTHSTYRAAQSPAMRSTLIADDPSTRKRARLSWYHPEDTVWGMVVCEDADTQHGRGCCR